MFPSDKRKNSRIKRQYNAQINVFVDGMPTEWEMVTLRDLSAGGMLFAYNKYLPTSTTIKAKINFPPADSQVEALGKVVRSDVSGVVRLTGISFTEIDPKMRSVIDEFANKFFPGQ